MDRDSRPSESSLTISIIISVRLISHRISFSDPATCYAVKWRSLSTSIQLIRVAFSCFKAAASPLNADIDGTIRNICKRASSPADTRCSCSKKSTESSAPFRSSAFSEASVLLSVHGACWSCASGARPANPRARSSGPRGASRDGRALPA